VIKFANLSKFILRTGKPKLPAEPILGNLIDQCGPGRTPDFFGIGTEKSGTTWLWKMFQKHPDIGVPIHKELRYFGDFNFTPAPLPNMQATDVKHHAFKALRLFLGNPSGITNDKVFLGRLAVEIRLLCNTDASYLGIFGQMTELVVGEITPQYCTMHPDEIRKMHKLAPNAKIIFLLRDPVDRAISGAKMKVHKSGQAFTDDAILANAFNDHQLNLSRYANKINQFESIFGNNVFIGFYDEIATAPLKILNRICTFLNVPYHPDIFATADQKHNVGMDFNVSPHVYQALYKELAGEYDLLEQRFPKIVDTWRKRQPPI
jgi:hypothetical protein